ncbi:MULTISPECIES: helix-turn-helix domain-containing protein [unclassified Aminobacter]|uniref:helix-turn-helix domain-containing protein n=1 Tax=unclassified Aminobacter TaxID=2644704 RepID=UPI0009FEC3AF|nr:MULTISPECIES: helix-turn-helix domain-containing protein [unclassified Aminobacter]
MREERQSKVIWDWTLDIWGWMPDRGRWSPAYGQPREPAYLEISTDAEPPHEAYDFWREMVWYGFDANRPKKQTGFQARASVTFNDDAYFAHYVSDEVSGGRSLKQSRADGHDGIEIGMVLFGQRRHRLEDDESYLAQPGQFFVYDSARPSQVEWDEHEGVHLSLRRENVEAALGRAMPSASTLAQALCKSRLAPVLRDQMKLFAAHMNGLARFERGFLFDQTLRLALFALEGLAFVHKSQASEPSRAALFVAAQRYIERHFTHFDLDANRIALALGTSRATLYRAFADHGLTIADTIREMRLARARRMLGSAPLHVPISEIAAKSGFTDMRTFHRAFRTRFNMSPGEARTIKTF